MNAAQRLSKSNPKGQLPAHRSTSESSSSDVGGTNAGVSGFYSAGPVLSLGTPVQLQTKEEDDGVVQQKCPTCETEDVNGGEEPVQLWDCTEYREPTCVQTQEASSELRVRPKCSACEAEEEANTSKEPVQREGSPIAPDPRMIQREARVGLKDASLPLPHGEQIQAAFGRHDVSQVRTSVGGSARTSNRRMGALAFTSGNRIGFRDSPSLHLAAHEAAHVVQQREGLSLPGNVGRPGDRWERHADRVADAVTGGRSAEGLLDEVAAPGTSSNAGMQGGANGKSSAPGVAVQHQITSRASRLFESPPVAPEAPGRSPEDQGKTSEGSPQQAKPDDRGKDASALEVAEAGDNEKPPEGVPEAGEAGAATPEAGASASSAGASIPAPGAPTSATGAPTPLTGTSAPMTGPSVPGAPEPSREASTPAAVPTQTPGVPAAGVASGSKPSGLCYNVDPQQHPENAQEPSSDDRGSKPKEKPQITFEAWPNEADQCPAKVIIAQGSQQMPKGIGGAPGSGGTSAEPAAQGAAVSGGGKVQAMSNVAPAGAEPVMSSGSPMDSQIANAEGERDAAINEYYASTEGLGKVTSRSQSLESGVTFPSAVGSQQFEARQAAMAQTRDFMVRQTGSIVTAVAFAQEQIPATLGAVAELAKASIQAAMENEKVAISERIAQVRALARAGAGAARAHVNVEYTKKAAEIESETLKAITVLDTTHTTSVNQVDEKETQGLNDVNSRFATGRAQHEAIGPEYAEKAINRGQEHAHAYEHCKRDYSDDGFWDGCLTVRRAQAQQDTACKTAAGYKDIFLRTANKKGYDLKMLRKQHRCSVISGAGQVNKTLDDTHEKLVSGLESGRTQALEGITLARDGSLAAIDNALAATLKSLSAQEFSQWQAVNDTGYLKQLAVEQLAHASAASFGRGISGAMDSLERTLRMMGQTFSKGNIPDPAALTQSLAATEAGLGGGMGSLLGKMAEGAQQAEERIRKLGAASLEALMLITTKNGELSAQAEDGFVQQMGGLKAGASKAIGQLSQDHVQKAKQALTEGTGSMEKAVAGFDKALGIIGGKIDGAIATSLQELDRDLKAKLGELDGQITREAWKAAEKEQPAWKKVLAIVLIILVIIAAALISIATLGAGASLFAIILVGALVGAVSAGLIQILNNWSSGESWHKGLVQAMIMGAIGGAIGGGLGFAGGALVQGAAAAGAGRLIQFGITIGADVLSEGLTQTVGYVAFGQEFNWQGFVMAGAMSGISFRAHVGGPHAGAPHPEVPTASVARAGGSGRVAVTRVVGGAALGVGLEYATAKISGQEFDPTRAASAAASAAVAAHASRSGHAARPTEITTHPPSAIERFRSFDPGGVGAKLESKLQGIGSHAFGPRPEEVPVAGIRPQMEEPVSRPVDEPTVTGTHPTEETGIGSGRTSAEEPDVGSGQKPAEEPAAGSGRKPIEEPGAESGRKPLDAEAAAELAGPANHMNEKDLIDATTTHAKIGDSEHDFHISREGPEVCTACGRTSGYIDNMLENLPPSPLREELQQLKDLVTDVQARMARGESGVDMVRDSARIAREFKALTEQHPSLARVLEEPHLHSLTDAAETLPHLRELEGTVVRNEGLDIRNFKSSSLKRGEQAIYILRDSSGAVLKVGIVGSGPGRFSKYLTAANNLGLNVRIEIAVVTPHAGKTIVDVETQLRNRLEGEGHVLPWDNALSSSGDPVGRLGRSGQGTPFVRKSQEPFTWTRDGRRIPIPETVANLRAQGRTSEEIIQYFTTNTTLTRRNAENLITNRFTTQIQAAESALNPQGTE
jgi:hypothetical protein